MEGKRVRQRRIEREEGREGVREGGERERKSEGGEREREDWERKHLIITS